MNSSIQFHACLLAVLLAAALGHPLRAQTDWGGNSGFWAGGVWYNGATPVAPPNSASANVQITTPNSLVVASGTYTVGELTLGSSDTLEITDSSIFTVYYNGGFTGSGTISNSGTLTVTGTGDTTFLEVGGDTFQGGGTVNVSEAGLQGSFTNVDNTIQGAGGISSIAGMYYTGSGNIVNEANGVIEANTNGQILYLFASQPGAVQNSGLLEASNGGILDLGGAVGGPGSNFPVNIVNTNGTIEALQNSTVNIAAGSTLQSGTITAQNGATVQLGNAAEASQGATIVENTVLKTTGTGQIVGGGTLGLYSFTNNGTFVVQGGGDTTIGQTIVNTGTISFMATTGTNNVIVAGPTSLTGGGTINLSSGSVLEGAPNGGGYAAGNSLDNVDNTIEGAVQAPAGISGGFAMTNESAGTVNANVSGQTLAFGNGGVQNYGTLEATNGGTLEFGSISNQSGGTIYAGSGSTVSVLYGISGNGGTITLDGGTVDNHTSSIDNYGQITGHGTIDCGTFSNAPTGGGLTNDGTFALGTGTSTVNGDVMNTAGHAISVTQGTATFNGNVTNSGTFTSTHSTITVTGTFTNNGALITDPSTLNFNDLNIGTSGYILGSAGDVFNVSGNVTNDSTNALFNISQATLAFQGAVNHTLTWSGADTLNFSIDTLELAAGGSLTLDLASGSSLHVTNLELDGGASQLADISINGGGTIYYDPNAAGNAYLDGQTYSLAGGGMLEAEGAGSQAVPEPSTWALLLGGCGALVLLGRRKIVVRG